MRIANLPIRVAADRYLHYGYRITATVLGLILISAAMAKLFAGSSSGTMNWTGMLWSPAVQMILIQVELFLGVLLVSNWKPQVIRLVAIFFFSCLALTSVLLIYEGQSDCGCFGSIKLDPRTAFLFDMVAVAALLVVRPGKGLSCEPSRGDETHTGLAGTVFCWIGVAGLVVGLGSAGAMAIGNIGFEGLHAKLRGDRITLSPTRINIGSGSEGEFRQFTFRIVNHADREVLITGCSATCSCSIAQKVPFTIDAQSTIDILGAATFRGTPGRFLKQFSIYTNHPDQTSTHARIEGRILEPTLPDFELNDL